MNERQIWADSLRRCLVNAKLNRSQVNAIMRQFANATSNGAGCETVFAQLCESYANQSTEQAVAETKSIIQTKLEELNQSKKVEANPIVRLRQAVERFNANLAKCAGVELVGVDLKTQNLLPHQVEAIERAREQGRNLAIKVPECLKPKSYEAIARLGNKQFKLELDIKP